MHRQLQARARPRRRSPASAPGSALELVGVVLDHCVGEKLSAYPLNLLAGPVLVAFGQIDLDVLALSDVVDADETQTRQGMLNSLALGIENAGLERDPDARLHRIRQGVGNRDQGIAGTAPRAYPPFPAPCSPFPFSVRLGADQHGPRAFRPRVLGQHAETARDLLIGLEHAAHVAAEAV